MKIAEISHFFNVSRETIQPLSNMDVSRETIEKLEIYVETLKEWQKTANLVSKSSLEHVWERHILDSLYLYPIIKPIKFNPTIADLGSGAGFPGMVLAIVGMDDGWDKIHLIESTGKKARFLSDVARRTNCSVTIHNGRAEDKSIISLIAPADIIVSRAVAPLNKLLPLAKPYMGSGSLCLFHKGKTIEEELTIAKKSWNISYQVVPGLQSGEGYILIIEDIKHV